MINEIQTKSKWSEILNKVEFFDFYHTYDYHQLSLNEGESPSLLVFNNNNSIIALPIIIRSIPNTEYHDITSVYGYAGPIYSSSIKTTEIKQFHIELNEFLRTKNVVSVFSRLHPYIKQQDILEQLGEIKDIGEVVNIDVTLPIEESRAKYGKSNKNQINKLRRTCEVVKAKTEQDILDFIDIYYENMRRLEASQQYFFSHEYFLNFMKSTDFKTDILLVKEIQSGKFIAGSMFVKTNDIVQFHLSGTRTDYLYLRPSKLFLDEMRLIATEEQFKYFNLGGGLGGEKDSLFDFKASFSKDFKLFKTWNYIVNKNVYDKLSEHKQKSNYFPLYRA